MFKYLLFFVVFNSFIFDASNLQPSKKHIDLCLGAYYFGAWRENSPHLTNSLRDSFVERKPIWGWVTSSQDIMNKQIEVAADAGLCFFSFCWYFNLNDPNDSLNNDLNYYHNSPQKSRLKFCLLVANHEGYEIGQNEWPIVTQEWIKQFKSGSYLNVNQKPLLIFFSINSLIQQFGSTDKVRAAFNELKSIAIENGLKGVSIAACSAPSDVDEAEECGFDFLTGYNYPLAGFTIPNQQRIPIDSMISAERRVWNDIIRQSSIPYIPVSTLGWDPRPWANESNNFANAPYYTGFSSKSVFNSVVSLKEWMYENDDKTVHEKVGLLYAWNEYGEGAWLTPSLNQKDTLLNGIRDALLTDNIGAYTLR